MASAARYDHVLLGAGVIGLTLARELAGLGRRVAVLDQGEPGQEASWAGAGILPPGGAAPAAHPLDQLRNLASALHAALARELREETGLDTGYTRCGGIYLARTVGEAAWLRGWRGVLAQDGVAFEELAAAEAARLEPALGELAAAGRLRAALRLPDEAQLRNPRHLRALLDSCRRRGVEIVPRAGAAAPRVENGRVAAVESAAGAFVAESYCLTAGAWTRVALTRLGVPTGILPVRGQMVLFRREAPPFTHVLNEGPRYLVPRDDGRVLAGSTEEEVGFDKRTTPEALAELAEFARELVPALRDAPIEKTWAGLRPGSFDGFPYMGPVPGIENLFVAAGHFRAGLHLSPAVAQVMRECLLGRPPSVDLAPFRVGRG